MSNDSYFLGVDFGTQGVRVGIVDMKGQIISSASKNYNTYFPKKGEATQKPNDWWNCFKAVMKLALNELSISQRRKIKSITVDATSATVLCVSEKGKPLSDAIMWMDNRSEDIAKRINEMNHPILEHCGGSVYHEWLLPKVLWFKEKEPEVYRKAFKIVDQLDFINYHLCSRWVASKVNAVCKSNFIDGIGYDKEFMESIGLKDFEEKLITDIVEMGTLIGYLNSDLASEFKIDTVPVIQGGIDGQIATLGMGVIFPGRMSAILGTSFAQMILTSNSNEKIKGIWGPYKNAMVNNLSLLETGQSTGGSIVKWYQEIFDMKEKDFHEKINQIIELIPIGSNGIRCLDFFQGNRTPYKDSKASGVIYGLRLNHTKNELYKALLESVAFGFKNIILNYENQGIDVEEIVCTGGVTYDRAWMQMLSDVTGKKLVINANRKYGSILGCAILGAVATEKYTSLNEAVTQMVHEEESILPNMKHFNDYHDLFKEYVKLYQKVEMMYI